MIKIIQDGQMVHLGGGKAKAGDREVSMSYSTVANATQTFRDEEIDPDFLKLVKDGDGPKGAVYVEDDDLAYQVQVPPSPAAVAPQSNQALNPATADSDELARLQGESDGLADELDQAQAEAQRLSDALSERDTELANLRAQVADLEERLEAAESEQVDENTGGTAQASAPEYEDDPTFDPDKVNQNVVLDYLKTASPDEVERVKALERQGQNRQGIGGYEPPED
jgi:hypothetical protein